MPLQLLTNRPAHGAPIADLILAHGAGAGMDSPFLTALAAALGHAGLAVTRFEFDYMAQRRTGGARRPPPKIDALVAEYRAVLGAGASARPRFIAGKSMGGRVASHLVTAAVHGQPIAGVIAFGYPFHPMKQPDKLRIAHLPSVLCPMLIIQGTRDPFGTRTEVDAYDLPPNIKLHWLDGGDHDFGFRPKPADSQFAPIMDAAAAVAAFVRRVSA